jgi:general secretion pathway protein G
MKTAPSFRRRNAGFTLLEIVIVIALIGLILGVVATKIMGSQAGAEYKLAGVKLDTIAAKVDAYEADTGVLPESLDNLVTAPSGVSGWLGPYAKAEDLKDPWHQPLQYRKPGADGKPFEIVSLGADRQAGGESVDADIVKP